MIWSISDIMLVTVSEDTDGMSPGRDIWRENSLPYRSEYEDSAIDFVWCFRST
jgi:hypothetical protein